MCSSYPESTQITPKSLIVASAQLRGQPDTAILNLCGIHEPQVICSVLIPSPVESCVPKRHHSDPTQVLTVRNALPSAWPDTIPAPLRSPQMAGRSSFLMPTRSSSCPPFTLPMRPTLFSAPPDPRGVE